ncbi:LOW QUALITY PROTEIN: single-strand selective monofunctional uracil DNA glycosylase [Camarhynchus parvulus]|uniref:LOW QUALITY PROTEIN: single-strand selective monofunctional uracil DNA glycosylase n=1 Tax=Geospiza parvula TaxID=87175 RepID=UPI00123805FA|nr:LOW QUALITY PROTEIN: single-strand selective monofunctional uracil DNA glycosylase [Camarhynchus parvulus]
MEREEEEEEGAGVGDEEGAGAEEDDGAKAEEAGAADDDAEDAEDEDADGSEAEGVAGRFLALQRALSERLRALPPPGPPVALVYAPLEYAWEPHRSFVRRFLRGPKAVLFLGMNPGPFGMAQTGVPFGEAWHVREWLRVSGAVRRPPREHPKRPVLGLRCPRAEVSGARFWGLVRSLCPDPRAFFRHCFVHNLCPLLFLAASGRNVAPPELRAAERERLLAPCGAALAAAVRALRVRLVVALGRVAELRAPRAAGAGLAVPVAWIPHPSPRNPRANRGWEGEARRRLRELGVLRLMGVRDEAGAERLRAGECGLGGALDQLGAGECGLGGCLPQFDQFGTGDSGLGGSLDPLDQFGTGESGVGGSLTRFGAGGSLDQFDQLGTGEKGIDGSLPQLDQFGAGEEGVGGSLPQFNQFGTRKKGIRGSLPQFGTGEKGIDGSLDQLGTGGKDASGSLPQSDQSGTGEKGIREPLPQFGTGGKGIDGALPQFPHSEQDLGQHYRAEGEPLPQFPRSGGGLGLL